MLNLSKVKFSKKDHVKKIRLPKRISSELAYLIGIHLGDGSMVYDAKRHDSWISYSGNLTEEYDWYINYLKPLIKKLFNINVSIVEDKRVGHSMIRIYFRSKAILLFLHKTVDLPLGNKKNCHIPKTIMKANDVIKRSFLRGLADTEFCIYFLDKRKVGKNHYPIISYRTSNAELTKEIDILFKKFGFKTYSRFNFKVKRNNKMFTASEIYLNGKDNLMRWMKVIGFSSPKHLTKYKIWKKFGYCPSYTTLIQRNKILNGKLKLSQVVKGALVQSSNKQ